MLFSKRSLEGYLRIDHRESPGLSPDLAPSPAGRSFVEKFLGAGKLFEGGTDYCNHCERHVIKNPFRVRDRGHCPKCDHFICDGCAVNFRLTGKCVPFKQIIDEFVNAAAKGKPLILP